ncbi:putative HECT domain-containing protein [Helianthus annuus]|nr:putative HECT domain-containing protein [Helianthus annuus]
MAATLRSNLPSRLRHLLSADGGGGLVTPNFTLHSDTPLNVKTFIDTVIQCPLQDIAIPLSAFRWEYNKGIFHHWRPLFLHFDTYFKTYLSTRKDLSLADDIVEEEDDTPFPKQSVLQILRVMQIILENCQNKSSFTGLEHLKLLLASTDPEVLIATLETLSSLVRINSSKLHATGKLVGCGSINSCLLSLAQGWGSKEEGLGLYSCVVSNEKTPDDSLSLSPSTDSDKSQNRMRSTLYFELHGTHTQDVGPSASVIHIPDLHTWKEDDLFIMKQLVEKYNVGPEHRFLLLTRIRYAHAFRSPRISRLYSKICLLAFNVLVQSGDSHDELVSFFANEPEYTNELIRLVKSEETISPTIRMLAIHALGSQVAAYSSSHERARILSTGGSRVIFINVLQKEISSLNKSTDPPSIAFIEALLQFHLLQVITTSSPGNIIRGSGMVSTFLPLLDDTEPTHMNLVCLAVKTLQKLMDYSNSAVTLLQDLGGVDLLTNRLHIEVVRMIDSMRIGESSDTIDDHIHSQHRLIRVLLKALSSATYASASTTRSQNPHDISLPATLSMIFKNMDTFGGDIYSSAVQVMCEMIHKDPTCYASLDEIGLPNAFLLSVTAGVLPSSKSLACVPNGLGAICLNTKGLEVVKEKSSLRFLVDIFTDEKYVLPMNDAIVPLANAVEELLRHVSSLRVTGVDLIIEIINKIASIVDRLAHVDQKLNADIISELLKKDAVVIDEEKQNKVQPDIGLIDIEDQKRLVEISCHYLKNHLPAETIHAVLQLCSTLTRDHSVAVSFLNAGGLPLLLSLPANSLFVGFDNVAATIIRHILEDPQTLQQAMESEIKQSVVTAVNRQSSSRLTPHNFLLNLTSVISRDPVVFMRAAQSVCQIEMVGDRPYVILLKGKSKEKEKTETMADGKLPEANVKHVKAHRKPPLSFVNVIELLLDSVMNFVLPVKDEAVALSGDEASLTDMDIDSILNKGKGKEHENESGGQELYASLAKLVFILKLLTDILLVYGPSVHVLLRRDGEITQKGHTSIRGGGVFHHILHQFLPYSRNSKKEKKTDVDWRHKLANRASQFLVAACVRSAEARKRVFVGINNVFTDFVNSSIVPQPPGNDIQAFVDLLSDVVAARSPTGSSISSEASVSFIDVGLIRSLTLILQVLDLDHPDSLKVAPGIVKVLEVVTKEHVHAAEKGDNTTKPLDHTENEQTENIGDISQSRETEPATDDMEHDQDNDVPPSEDDYMHETSGNTNGFDSVGIRFEIQPDSQESLDEDDDEMSGDEGDEGDEEEEEEEEEEEDGGNNDLEDEVHHHLPHLDTDQDDNEIDEDEFDEDMIEEEDDEEDEEDGEGDGDGRVILGLSEEMNGINMLDHIEVFGRDNDDTFHMMPVEVFGSRRQGRTTSIYNLLGRSRETSAPAQHPLLIDPSSRPVSSRQAGNTRDRNLESTSSRLDSVFRSLRNGRRGHRSSMWADDLQTGGSNPSSIPSGLEDLLVSHLRPPTPVNPPDHDTGIEGHTQDETAGMVPEPTTENTGVSQENNENETTLGESHRSLDVEIGSANASLVNTTITSASGSLHSVPEVSENHSQEIEQGAAAADARIDPTFLDALPDELRAEVLSGQSGPVTQVLNTEHQNGGVNDIDPEFLAALPPDIRAEVLAQQQAQAVQRSQELEGQPVEMDTVSIIATFPSEIREEVLLTSSDDVLSNLTPALVAEANMLRERFRRHNRTLFGMFPRSRRGESSRGGEGSLDRVSGTITHRSTGSQPIETEGAPLVDTKDLKAMTRLLRVVQPLYKPQLQRLLLNLCAHVDTRSAMIKILMDLLVLDTRNPNSDLNASEPSYRLYACQSHLMYSRAQSFDGVPPLVSRRVLETLTFLARNHKFVAKLLLQFRIQTSDQARGKAVMIVQDDESEKHQYHDGVLAITLLLSLLKQPLYLRSIAHLEQLLNLLDVIIDNAERMQVSVPHGEPVAEESAQMSTLDGETNPNSKLSKIDDASKPSSSGVHTENESHTILLNLPQAELRLLCSLLANESLSDNAYALVADILKKLVAIAPLHCHLFITELAGSMKNLTKLAINELRVFGEMEKALINTSGSDGAAILRVIQALSSLVATLNQEKDNVALENEQSATLALVNDINADLEPLWMELSTCISKIESFTDTTPEVSSSSSINLTSRPSAFPPLPAGTQNILPHIESFFVTSEKLHFGHDSDDVNVPESHLKPLGTSVKVDEKNVAFVRFAEKHRKLLNGFIRQNPGLLEKSFSVMLKVPRFIDFDNKRSYFRSKIKHQHEPHHHSGLRISVRRAYILEDSYNQLRMRSTEELKGRLTVHFQGEEGIDGGGLTREWYQLLSRVIFDKGALLFTTVGNESTFQPNPNSVFQTEHISYFKFVGRVVGKALFDGQLLDVHFTRSFYKHMLGAKVTYHDIEAIDPGYFKNLKWMLENDISDVLDLTFSIDADEEKLILFEKAQVTDYELIPGGRNIRVAEENKHEYVNLIAEHRLTTAIRPQINAFLEGFNELIPRGNISIFHDKELELLISGLPDIDLDDMRANTEYSGYSAASPVIHWFWEVAQGLSKEDKARLLQFVTGTSKVPLEGFSALQGISGSQKFQIHKAYGSSDRLPSAHTCFNQLDLPEYPSKQHLEERLLLAIHEANEGFGFG